MVDRPGIVLLAWVWAWWTAGAFAADPQPPLRWAADAEGGAPYICKSPNDVNTYVGFEVEIAAALEKQLGRKIQFVQYDFKSLTSGLQRGDFDFAMNGVEMTPDRIKALRFSRPYYIYTLQLVARANEARFDSLESCKRVGAVVGTMEDTAAERLLDRLGIAKKVYGNQVEPYTDLSLGRLDAVLLDLPIAAYYGKPKPDLKYVGPAIAPGCYGIAFRKDQESLARRFDAALDRLAADGTLRRIYEKWNIWNEHQERLLGGGKVEDFVSESGRRWSFDRYFPLLLRGAVVTVELTLVSMAVAMVLGMPIALARLYGHGVLRTAAIGYVEFFRGIPVLLLLYFLYYGLPVIAETYHLPFGLRLPPMAAAILGFGLNYAAYQAEIYRAGLASISVGQWEAGMSLGMSRLHVFRRIILPQAVRVILPPTTNDLVALFKDTSIVSIIAVEELTKEYQILAKSSLKYIEIGLVTAMLYLMMSVPLGYLSRYLEKRWGKGH
ncbi:MAG: ABC transporter substrate-binding protein/permease [Planctomycetaceae bacterium]|nr:ABC transporter substrate-binding protein/permease [Planctomycetaceae bacterium]